MWSKPTPDDFSTEIRAHLDLETDRLIAEGMAPEEARLAARKAFGSVAAAEERYFESTRAVWLDQLRQDVRVAARSITKYPVAAIVAVASLAFGIGAMTTTLMVRDVIFRKPPRLYQRPAAHLRPRSTYCRSGRSITIRKPTRNATAPQIAKSA